jgi:hypothetical protein
MRLRARRAQLAVIGAFGVYLTVTSVRVWPYFLDYYGEQVGGPYLVWKRQWFEIGWWGEGIEEAVAHVNANAAPGDLVYRGVEPVHVNWLREDLWTPALSPPAARWVIVNDAGVRAAAMRGTNIRLPEGYEADFVVRAQGAALVTVYKRKD